MLKIIFICNITPTPTHSYVMGKLNQKCILRIKIEWYMA